MYKKMQIPQKFKRQREIAKKTEEESNQLLSENKGICIDDIKNYTTDSKSINNISRKGNENISILKLDKALSDLHIKKMRVTYRVMTYLDRTTPSPWGEGATGQTINKGDLLSDKAYLSTSAHRGFLSFTHPKQTEETRYTKLAFIGDQGVNVAGASQYNCDKEKAIFPIDVSDSRKTFMERMKIRVRGPQAGQAEILMPRNTVFEVMSKTQVGNTTYALLQQVNSNSVQNRPLKDFFTGQNVH